MKILHFADLHFGVDNYSKGVDPVTGASPCFQSFIDNAHKIVDHAEQEEVDCVVFAGDAFKSREPSPTQLREFAKLLARLAYREVPVFLNVGNHDMPGNLLKAHSLEIFGYFGEGQVIVGDRLGVYEVETKSGPLQILNLPWVSRARMDALRSHDGDPPDASIPDAFRCMLDAEIDKLDPDIPAIMAAHAHVSGALAGSEMAMTISGDPIFEPSDLAYPELSYVALGHIHKMQVIPCDTVPIIYPGSIQRLDFGEEGEPKGFYVVDIESPGSVSVSYNFVELPARNFLTIDITIPPGDENPTKTALCAIAERPIKDAIVRLRIDIDEADRGRLNESTLYDTLKSTQYARIEKQIQHQRRTRVNEDFVESATPLEMLGRYLDSKGTPRDYSDALMKQAAVLMKEVEDGMP